MHIIALPWRWISFPSILHRPHPYRHRRDLIRVGPRICRLFRLGDAMIVAHSVCSNPSSLSHHYCYHLLYHSNPSSLLICPPEQSHCSECCDCDRYDIHYHDSRRHGQNHVGHGGGGNDCVYDHCSS